MFTYEIALRNEKGDVLRNFGGSFVVKGSQEYLLISDLINFASCASERANKADNSQSDAIAALQKEVQWLKDVIGQHQSFVGLHTKLGGNSARL